MTTLEELRSTLGYRHAVSLHGTLRSLWTRDLILRHEPGVYSITRHGMRTRARICRGELPLDIGASRS